MNRLDGKRIVVGVTGSIAAYKSAFLVRELVRAGAETRVVMTPAACEFIPPLTLATLSRSEVIVGMFPREGASGTWHIHLGMWADAMIIAPASANTIAKLAHGFADNALTALVLALRCPLIVSPAMDTDMYTHPATRENLARLRDRGVTIIEPDEGELASGLSGSGRLPDIERLLDEIGRVVSGGARDLDGVRVLVSAGPTREAIDPVRYIGNRSSGKMGFAIAAAAASRGATVTLVSGPVHLSTPAGVTRIDVESALQMRDAVARRALESDVIVMAAAVADFRPVEPSVGKLKKEALGEHPSLALERNPDILLELGRDKGSRILVGFALETDDTVANALVKLSRKNADFIVLNNPLEAGAGFETDTNIATILTPDGRTEETGRLPKVELAHRILDRIVAVRAAHAA